MTDLISRADAIEAVASITMSIHLSDVICDKLLALPSADVEWIPITTSEPTTSNHVLVTYNWGDDDYDDYEVSELDYWVTKHEAENGNEKCKRLIDHVIAWQSLPTPYKGGDAE